MKHQPNRVPSATKPNRAHKPAIVGATLVALLTLGIAPAASAGKAGGKPVKEPVPSEPVSTEPATAGPIACSELTDSLTFAALNDAIGVTPFHTASGSRAAVTGAGIDIALIDTGITAVAGLNTIDGPDLSFDAMTPELRNEDLHGHGTNMAGIVAAVAPGSRVVDVKVGAADGTVDVSQVIAGIDWVVENKDDGDLNIRVINLAYDTDAVIDYQTDPLTRAVENAWHKGIVVVVAGGNDGRSVRMLGNPAVDPFVIAVGATETKSPGDWKIPSFSSTGDDIRNPDLVAPGASVLSLAVPGSYLADTYPAALCADDGTVYLRGSGTSQAAAVVAGSVAMLLEARPELQPNQVKALLTGSATKIMSKKNSPSPENQQGSGMLNVAAALKTTSPSLSEAKQTFPYAQGGGSLEGARGTFHVGAVGDQLTGEFTAFGAPFDSKAHSWKELFGSTWTNQTWDGASWSGGTWSGASWSGASWSGASWSGASWSGASWSGASWSGASWSGASWSGASWSGASWSGASWSGASWSGASWSGAAWS